MISVNKVTRKYGDVAAVDDVSFAIAPREIVGLLGHNGAGKTTIMKMITGYLEPTSGTITVNGTDVAMDRRLIQRQIGYLPENCPVYPEMTVYAYLDYAAALHGLDPAQRPRAIASAIARTELADKANRPIATLSRGYRQRTGVAQAILHDPAILILDEPTNGLDPNQIQQMRGLIRTLAEKATVIVSTHILQEVQAVCDRVIILKDGKVALDSRLDALNREARLQVDVDAAPDVALPFFGALAAVARVEQARNGAARPAGHSYSLALADGPEPHEAAALVAGAVHAQGWRLYALGFATRTLESVFAEISGQ